METPALDERYAPPQAHVQDIEPEQGSSLAGRGTRLIAAIIDGVIQLAAAWVFWLLTPFSPWGVTSASDIWTLRLANIAFGLAVFLVFQGYLLATRGQTIGKWLLDIRIVRPDGSRASAGRVLGLRYGVQFAIGWVPIVGQIFPWVDALFIFRESRRCLHDSIADTIVVCV